MENFATSMRKNLRLINSFVAYEEPSSEDEPQADENYVPRLSLLADEE